jgi:hypothetical protein
MAATPSKEIVLMVPPTLLGPESEYEKARLFLGKDIMPVVLGAAKIEKVETVEDLELANGAGRVLQAAGKQVEEFFKPIKVQIDLLKDPVLEAERVLKNSIDFEKKRLGALITAYRQKEELARLKSEAEAREAAAAAERESILQRAVEAEAAGDIDTAVAILEEPVIPMVVAQRPSPVKMAGQVGKVSYSATVTDFRALVRAVAEGKAPVQCLKADEQWINAKARLDKDSFLVPGVKLNKESSTHFRSS